MKNRGATSDEMVLYRYCMHYTSIYILYKYMYVCVYIQRGATSDKPQLGIGSRFGRAAAGSVGGPSARALVPLRRRRGARDIAPGLSMHGPEKLCKRLQAWTTSGLGGATVNARTREAVQALTSLDDERTGRCDC